MNLSNVTSDFLMEINGEVSKSFYQMRHLYNLGEDDFMPEEFPLGARISILCAYIIVIFTAISGNSLVLFIILKNPKMRTVTNTFLVSLAVGDLIIVCVNMPIQLHFYLANYWALGMVMCKLTRYIQGISIASSILTLTGIAFDRYYAILYPFQARHVHTSKRAVILLLIFWGMSGVILIPQILIQRVDLLLDRYSAGPDIVTVCGEYFPEDWMEMVYSSFYPIVLLLVPALIMAVTYGKIAHRLWFRQIILETFDQRREDERRLTEKKRVIRMLIVIVFLFIICWIPFFSCQMYLTFNFNTKNIQVPMNIRLVVVFLQLVGYCNSCSNPIVYWFMNENFQQHFLQTCCAWKVRRKPRSTSSSSSTSRRQSSLDFDRVLQSQTSTNQSSV